MQLLQAALLKGQHDTRRDIDCAAPGCATVSAGEWGRELGRKALQLLPKGGIQHFSARALIIDDALLAALSSLRIQYPGSRLQARLAWGAAQRGHQ
jgi:hypothetical protein